jgi:hypothetical protein
VETLSTDLTNVNAPYELSTEEIPLLGQIYPHLGQETPEDTFISYPNPITKIALDDVALYLHSSGWFTFTLHLFSKIDYLSCRQHRLP